MRRKGVERDPSSSRPGGERTFRHEALFYAGEAEFLRATTAFIEDAVVAGEPILVVVGAAKIVLLQAEIGVADIVHFADMAEVGMNPARIIPAWQEFVDRHDAPGRRFRGIGEPVWADRSPAELVECQRHESLLNVAFEGAPAWWLLCPYDTAALRADVIDEARRSHPFVMGSEGQHASREYRGFDASADPFDQPLPHPPADASVLTFALGPMDGVRRFVSRWARAGGLGGAQTSDLVVAVNEIATNSVMHGGGGGTLRMWREGDNIVCEIQDVGRIDDPLVGRERPDPAHCGGRGLWIANQLCDLVQVRSFPDATVVRLHLRSRAGAQLPAASTTLLAQV